MSSPEGLITTRQPCTCPVRSVLSQRESQIWRSSCGPQALLRVQPLDEEKPKPKPRKKKVGRPAFIARNIDHPFFKNLSNVEAVEYLKGKPIGEVVIRPSSKGVTTLADDQVRENTISHYDVIEEKPGVGTLPTSRSALR